MFLQVVKNQYPTNVAHFTIYGYGVSQAAFQRAKIKTIVVLTSKLLSSTTEISDIVERVCYVAMFDCLIIHEDEDPAARCPESYRRVTSPCSAGYRLPIERSTNPPTTPPSPPFTPFSESQGSGSLRSWHATSLKRPDQLVQEDLYYS